MSTFRSIKGVKDILPENMPRWNIVEDAAHRFARNYGFHEIRIPTFENTELYIRSIGGATDVVEKEMYTFPDRDGSARTLRPEGTAGVARAYIEHHLGESSHLQKLYYLGPMFRHERPQAGRFRQFHQFGVEAIGKSHPFVDVEIVDLLWNFFSSLDLPGLNLEMNSLGTLEERQEYKAQLLEFLTPLRDDLCGNCQRRLENNPLRVLDCKVITCRNITEKAPKLLDCLKTESSDHFQEVLTGLESLGIPYTLNHRLVRGLDYYSMTTFEVTSTSLGAQNTLVGGGRYDGLMKALGGPPTPAIGFAVGLDRVVLALPDSRIPPKSPLVFLASFGKKGFQAGMQILQQLRLAGIQADTDYQSTSLKNLLRSANRLGATHTLILGDDEVDSNHITLRNMETKVQENLPLDSIHLQLPNHLK